MHIMYDIRQSIKQIGDNKIILPAYSTVIVQVMYVFNNLHVSSYPRLPSLPCTSENVGVSGMINQASYLLLHTVAPQTNLHRLKKKYMYSETSEQKTRGGI